MSAVEEVKARLDIVEVIGQHVRLQKAGRSFKGLCPFHSEKTPSFIVNPDRQSWHCFGACGTGGDVISFVQRKENLEFGAALRLLAERAGVVIESDARRRDEVRTLQDVNETAALFFHNLLLNTAAALAYCEERGLDRQAVSDFQLGFAPPGWEHLKDHLVQRGYSERQLLEAGLLVESDRGTTYDRFRDRLIFPIRDERGRVVGFGARVMPGASVDAGAKYINTPVTPIFDKGSIFYGLDRARDEIRRTGVAVIVEGYMDVIAAHQHGFRNVVASMGTSLTERQALLARRFASTVVLALDADEAGNAATLRGIQVVAGAIERGANLRGRTGPATPRSFEVRVAALPDGVDPDDLIRTDPTHWEALIKTARPVIDHLYTVVTRGRDLNDPRQRGAVVAELLPAIAELPSPVQQADWIQRLGRGRVREDELWRQLRALQRRRGAGETRTASEQPSPQAERYRVPREEFLLSLLFKAPVGHLANRVSEDLFSLSENAELFRRWRRSEAVDEDDPWLFEHYQRVLHETRIPASETHTLEEAFLDCVRRLELAKMRLAKEASVLALAEGEAKVRQGQVASIARTWLETGQVEDAAEDDVEKAVASQLLEDMEVGLRFHRGTAGGTQPGQSGPA